MRHIIVDRESNSLRERFALVKTPRTTRKRCPEGCVQVVASEQAPRDRNGRTKASRLRWSYTAGFLPQASLAVRLPPEMLAAVAGYGGAVPLSG